MDSTEDKTLEVYINSSIDKVNTTDTLTDWVSYFKIPVAISPNETYGLAVKKSAICNTIPQFNKVERVFKLNNTVIEIDGDRIFTNTQNLCLYLTALCSSNGFSLSFTIDDNTKRVRLTNNTTSDIIIDLAQPYLSFWAKIGFQYDLTLGFSNVTIEPSGDILLKYITKLIPTQRIYICCDDVIPNSSYPTNSNKGIISSIDLLGGYGSYNFSVEPFLYFHQIKYTHAFSSLSFSVLDDNYRPIELKGGSINLSLVIKKIK